MQAIGVVPFIPGPGPLGIVTFSEQDPAFARSRTLAGVTRDSVGAPLAACTVKLFRTADDALVAQMTSGAGGAYSFNVPSALYYVVAYLPGSPDKAGTSVNTLLGV